MAHDEKRFPPHHQLEKFYCPALRERERSVIQNMK